MDGDEVTMRGTINGKTLYGLSAPLRLVNVFKRGNGNVHVLYAYLFDENLNYYRTIVIQAILYPKPNLEGFSLVDSCYILAEE